jgi:hypothetical protein
MMELSAARHLSLGCADVYVSNAVLHSELKVASAFQPTTLKEI